MRESRGLMGLPAPPMGYDGMVMIGQRQVQVNDGVLEIQGKRLHVAEDGQVKNDQDQTVARVVNGQLVPAQQQAPQPQQQGQT